MTTVLDPLLNLLCLYGAGAFTCLTTGALYIVTTPRFTQHVFTPQARRLGIHPRVLVMLTVIGCAVLWPVTAIVVGIGRLWWRP
ncbi:hypothetical protein [Streptosporangium sp. NPDC051022]|uniref:hypothetical protein n=1 Tax=Streptosporangium sp. NPDC051022 TaxID=3155752 RepID=UPI00344747F2